MISDDQGLPKTLAGLFAMAGHLYVRRFGLYATLAAIGFAIQYVVGVVLPHSPGLVTGLAIVVDAFVVAAVSIGVAFDVAGKDVDWSTVLLAANERWGAVTVVGFLYYIIFVSLQSNVFGSPEDTGYGMLALPVIVFWEAVALGQVVAAIEPVKTQFTLPFVAVGKGMSVAFRWPNLGRLALLALIVVLPVLLMGVVLDALTGHHARDAQFWAGVPIDAITIGPLQVLSTVFYIDFLRRAR